MRSVPINPAAGPQTRKRLLLPLFWLGLTAVAPCCPFCGPVAEPLASRRARCLTFGVGETLAPATPDEAGRRQQPFRLLATAVGNQLRPVTENREPLIATVTAAFSGTAVLFETRPADWQAVAADELLIGYCLTAAPPVTDPQQAADRLRWFAHRLEHPNAAIAADAYAEYALAPFAVVREATTALDAEQLASWLTDPAINPQRRGFYGLAAGLVARQRQGSEASCCRQALHQALAAPRGSDFQAGTDGLLAGLLIADGAEAINDTALGLFAETASPVDQRHLLNALRFAWEEPADTMPRHQTVATTRRLLALPHLAREAIIDLARYQDWEALPAIVPLWDELGQDDPLIRPAVAGYLVACPQPAARQAVEQLRRRDADAVAAAIAASRFPLPAATDSR